jgi:hypothetical protein
VLLQRLDVAALRTRAFVRDATRERGERLRIRAVERRPLARAVTGRE